MAGNRERSGGVESSRHSQDLNEVDASGVRIRKALLAVGTAAARYTRFEIEQAPEWIDPPVMLVANHGFGGILDLNALLLGHLLRQLGVALDEPAVLLTHQMAWDLGVGPYLEPAGFRPANRENAKEALDAGVAVVVMPGGDLDGAKPWTRRNEVCFHGRSGFVSIAQEAGVPMVPVTITGAGDTLVNFTDGRRLASLLGLDRWARTKALPISFALPWGLNVGIAALGYLPWPAKTRARVGEPITVTPEADPAEVASEVERIMNEAAHQMTDGRNAHLDLFRRSARTGG